MAVLFASQHPDVRFKNNGTSENKNCFTTQNLISQQKKLPNNREF
jgi:hypothetical protein